MATKIRLKRFGGKHDPHFRIVVADSRKRRDGSSVEELGYYSPAGSSPRLEVNGERTLYWLGVGAQPTDTVHALLVRAGVIGGAGEAPAEEAAPEEAGDDEPAEAEVAEEASETQ
ncbi:MAG: 30S ribosomal protein S16 [Armatimonadota bacterium]